MNQVDDKVDQLLRLLMLAEPDQYWPLQRLPGGESTSMPEEQKNKLLGLLAQKHASTTFGQILSEQFRTTNVSAPSLATELGLPTEVIEYLVSDTIHPATIPILVMKRLLERLNVSLETARTALRASFEQFKVIQLAHQPTLGFGMAARKTSELDTTRSATGWQDLVGNEESLNQYLERLAQYMPS
ncbi:hypothetical protein J2I47_08020 [Fibrella sp. HMF5335]|uniref:Uncharacterized protein n=1 Tax=Fibrella rubiginis TaxID=2817060 RepID=A0A939GFE0_9BACT|nr:hypothetical protein [Fibrella rubiginis]MBO0936485.1 hypothetical protein [Fibrella rubiginis]